VWPVKQTATAQVTDDGQFIVVDESTLRVVNPVMQLCDVDGRAADDIDIEAQHGSKTKRLGKRKGKKTASGKERRLYIVDFLHSNTELGLSWGFVAGKIVVTEIHVGASSTIKRGMVLALVNTEQVASISDEVRSV